MKDEKIDGKVIEFHSKLKKAGIDPDEMARYEKLCTEAAEKEREQYQKKHGREDGLQSKDILAALYAKEDGDAWLFRELHKDTLCFDHAAGLWYTWAGHYWELDKIGQVTAAIDEVINKYAEEASRCAAKSLEATKAGESESRKRHDKAEKDFKDRIAQLQHWYRKGNVLKLSAVGKGSLGITGEEWDLNPWLLGCPNGTLNLKNGEFTEGRPSDFIKTICPTEWEGIDTPAPIWERFLFEIFNKNADLVAYIQRLFGFGLTGLTTEHVFPIFWGQGRNGKTTMLEALANVMGQLVGPIQAEMLLDQGRLRSSAGPSADLMALRGRRIAWGNETDEGRRLNAGKLKSLTGGDSITARPPFGKREITFKPTHTLLLLTNHKPRIAGDEYALWKRLHLVPFPLSFVPDPDPALPNERLVDTRLPQKLEAEAPGILAWLVRGCLEWQKQGLNPPDAVKAATDEYRSEEDVLGIFLDECCDFSPTATVRAGVLHAEYKRWCEKNGYYPMSMKTFGQRMGARFDKSSGKSRVFYRGLSIKVDDEFDSSDSEPIKIEPACDDSGDPRFEF